MTSPTFIQLNFHEYPVEEMLRRTVRHFSDRPMPREIIEDCLRAAGIVAGTILGYAFGFSRRFRAESPMLPAFDLTTAAIILVIIRLAAVFSAALATQPVIRQKVIKILCEK